MLNQDFVWADRYLAPLWPFFIAFLVIGLFEICDFFSHQRMFKPAIGSISVLLIFVLSIIQNQEVNVWRDNPTLWARVAHEDPSSIKSLNNYAHALFQSGHEKEAEIQADRGVELMKKQGRGFTEVIRSSAAIKFSLGKSKEATDLLKEWEHKGYDSFQLRAQGGIISYFNGDCVEGDLQFQKAKFFAKNTPAFKTDRDLDLLSRLREQCFANVKPLKP